MLIFDRKFIKYKDEKIIEDYREDKGTLIRGIDNIFLFKLIVIYIYIYPNIIEIYIYIYIYH